MVLAGPYDAAEIRRARADFLEGDRGATGVRSDVRLSWTRSRMAGVSPDTPQVPFSGLRDDANRLRLAAQPILDRFAASLTDTRTSIVLADRRGLIVGRWTGTRQLARKLEAASIAEGFTYTEDAAGTNSIGTALEEHRPVVIRGPEHYAEALHPLTCVGVPVRHPVTRHLTGVVNIACPNIEVNHLLLPVGLEIGREIEQRLGDQTYERERALLERFLRRTWGSSRPTVTLTQRLVLANPAGARLLEGVDQALLWEQASAVIRRGGVEAAVLHLAGGRTVLARCHAVEGEGDVTAAMIEVVNPSPAHHRVLTGSSPPTAPLAGRSRVWSRALRSAEDHAAADIAVLIVGEPGVGKRTVAQRMANLRDSADAAVCDGSLEAVDGTGAWLRATRSALRTRGTVIVAHLEALSADGAQGLAGLVDTLPLRRPPRLIGTAAALRTAPSTLGLLERFSGARIPLPALRERPDDVGPLLEVLTRRYASRPVRWSPEAVQALLRLPWPGNVRQLANVVRSLVAGPGVVEIGLADLPVELRSAATGRRLSRIEQIELDAIQSALEEAGGNRLRAAELLGLSRSTLYRRLRAYGLNLSHQVF